MGHLSGTAGGGIIAMGFKPKFADCTKHPGCWVKKYMPDFEPFKAASIEGQLYIGDIDGLIVLENGNTLFLEYKTAYKPLTGPQRKAYKRLTTIEGQTTLVVWHEKDFPDRPVDCQFISNGSNGKHVPLPKGQEDLVGVVRNWAKETAWKEWIEALPAPSEPSAKQDMSVMNEKIDFAHARDSLQKIELYLGSIRRMMGCLFWGGVVSALVVGTIFLQYFLGL